jgi:hypothetical protein
MLELKKKDAKTTIHLRNKRKKMVTINLGDPTQAELKLLNDGGFSKLVTETKDIIKNPIKK